ncbi:Multidrug resistance-associated protein 9 [Nymphon striatum]|nr:Multidrug resistance-associated protein 9 [Nymphon striatum]
MYLSRPCAAFPLHYTFPSAIFVGQHEKRKDGVIPVENIGCISSVLFSWLTPLMWKGYKQGLEPRDVYKCPISDSCFKNGARLSKLWTDELARKGPDDASLIKVLFRFLRTRIILQCFLFTCVVVLGILAPAYFMLKIIEFIESGSSETHIGISWAIGLTLVELTRTTIMTGLWGIALRSATRIRSACMHLLYRKIFKMADTGERSIGELVNMFSNDASTLYDAPLFIPLIIGGPLMIIAGLIYVYWILGAMSLVGMSVFLIFFPIQVGISKMIGKFRKKTLKIKDIRANKMTELVTCIKLIKLYAWESAFADNINAIRQQEKRSLEKAQYMQSFSLSLAPAVPVMAAVVTFLVHIAVKGDLTAAQAFSTLGMLYRMRSVFIYTSFAWNHITTLKVTAKRLKAFTTLTLYYITGMAIRTLPHEIRTIILTKISINRIKNVLTSPEIDPYISLLDKKASDHVRLVSATLSWDYQKAGSSLVVWQRNDLMKPMNNKSDDSMIGNDSDSENSEDLSSNDGIKNINMCVEKGSLVAVIGRTGSGKSSLLAALLGKMTLLNGTVSLGGSCAYVGQQPWIMNGTLRENVLLDTEFDPKWYYHVIHSCELTDDIAQLPGGDNTQVGDRGVRLSGGQKLRVCLARALYSKREIYLLDDCFSAVDSKVAMKIFNTVIRKTLAKRTVIIVTHNVQFLEYFDEVILMEGGRIKDVGSHHSLLQSSVNYNNLIASFENLQKCEDEKIESPKMSPVGELNKGYTDADGNARKDADTKLEVKKEFDQLYDQCSAPLYLYNCANRWIGIRLEAIAISMTMVTAILTVVLRDKISPAYAGLALSYTVLAEADFTSYERQLSYSEILKNEESEMKEKNEKIVLQECPENWPIRGRISFQNVSMRYQPTLLPVLRGVTFDVFPGEKIGIIGRTGAGKSSLGVVLFRLVEISTGLIYIDGIDISTLPLHDLRSKLSIIPQDPIMFEGTLRDNLDPTGEYTDNELWKALEKSFMKSKIVSLGGHLLAPVRANGNNFSVGQRQLLCLARAILKKSKTWRQTALIQRTLQDFFGNSTVLTIAHRLHTVKGCDRILVMHNGRVAEFDEPTRLLVNPKSLFSTMMAASTTE